MPLRFPNPGSDIARMIHSYSLIHCAAKQQAVAVLDLDFMSKVLTDHLQASSRGAVGAAAQERSADVDRSRDPLYNQLKMYSEVYRMLGWLRPGDRRLEFTTTILGDLVAEDFAKRPDLVYGLLRQCLLSVTFPNPATHNVGVLHQRPFRWLLRLATELGGVITRHEMILGLLAVLDDQEPDAFPEALGRVESLRGGSRSALYDAAEAYAKSVRIQLTTLENYTRLPVGVLKSPQLGWGTSGRVTGIYDKPVEALTLTVLGRADAEWLLRARDVREEQLVPFSADERACFANYAYYSMLIRAGVAAEELRDEFGAAAAGAHRILAEFGIDGPMDLLYSPVQQASNAILQRAGSIE